MNSTIRQSFPLASSDLGGFILVGPPDTWFITSLCGEESKLGFPQRSRLN